MARSIQPGDLVTIFLGGQSGQYLISSVQPDSIEIHPINEPQSISRLIVVNGQWKIEGTDLPYRLEFTAADTIISSSASNDIITPSLTGIFDADLRILNQLDDQTLLSACQTDRYINSLCGSKELWIERVNGVDPFLTQYKPAEQGWRDYYFSFGSPKIAQEIVNKAAGDGYLGILKVFKARYKILPNPAGVIRATRNGHLDVLKWLSVLKPIVVLNQYIANVAFGDNLTDIVSWLAQQQPPFYPNWRGANYVANRGNLDLLKQLAQRGILPTRNGAGFAARNGRLDILEWLAQQRPPILPDQQGVKIAAKNGHLDVLIWVFAKDPSLINSETANSAAEGNRPDVLEWLAQQQPPILPD